MIELTPLLQIVAAASLGFLYLLAGYRWARLMMKMESAALFAVLGTLACKDSVHWSVLLALAIGLAVLGWKFGNAYYFLHVVIVGMILGVVAAWLFHGRLEWVPSLAGAAAGVTLGILMERPFLIAATSAIGAFLLAAAASGQNMTLESWVLWVVLTVLGTIYQRQTSRQPAPSDP